MGLRLAGRWVWDFWLVQDRGLWHVFFLHAPRTPDDPDKRHFSARIGHATSADLRSWRVLDDALGPGPQGAWDDMATWTGSVVSHPESGWAMLYTGVSSREDGLVQRIGVATSPDLMRWTKLGGNPLLEAPPEWYEQLDTDVWFDQAWRDPWVVQGPDTGIFHAFMTARMRAGPPQQRGVIGHATSRDLESWEVGPPLQGPQGFGYMEIPQVLRLEGRWHLLFSAPAWAQASRPGSHCTGTFHAIADQLTGPYREIAPLFCDKQHPREQESLYGGKLIVTDDGLVCMAFRYLDTAGGFIGELTDPMPVNLAADGTLALLESHPY